MNTYPTSLARTREIIEWLDANAKKFLVVLQLKVTSVVLIHGTISVVVACRDIRERLSVEALLASPTGRITQLSIKLKSTSKEKSQN